MKTHLAEDPISAVTELIHIPTAFEVKSIFEVTDPRDRSGRFLLTERPIDAPYTKDYDLIASGRVNVDQTRSFESRRTILPTKTAAGGRPMAV